MDREPHLWFSSVTMVTVVSYTIYHSPNAYLGVLLAERALAGLPVVIERRPICIPKARGVKVADLVGSKEGPAQSSYHREDCMRWAHKHGISCVCWQPASSKSAPRAGERRRCSARNCQRAPTTPRWAVVRRRCSTVRCSVLPG